MNHASFTDETAQQSVAVTVKDERLPEVAISQAFATTGRIGSSSTGGPLDVVRLNIPAMGALPRCRGYLGGSTGSACLEPILGRFNLKVPGHVQPGQPRVGRSRSALPAGSGTKVVSCHHKESYV
jgi:hypothetical protein